MMTRLPFILFSGLLLPPFATQAETKQPNVVILFTDDKLARGSPASRQVMARSPKSAAGKNDGE
jgi:hypothetical protein